MSISDLIWEPSSGFTYDNLVRISVPADGSCFFHAILLSFYKPYQQQREGGIFVSRKSIVKDFRHDLSIRLGEPSVLEDPSSPIVYQTLSRGRLGDFSKVVPNYSLASMKAELDSTSSVGDAYLEFISNELNKDIYLLDADKRDVYIINSDVDLFYKDRTSIVLLYLPGHFDLVGLRNNDNTISTFFTSDHPLIEAIKRRLRSIVKL